MLSVYFISVRRNTRLFFCAFFFSGKMEACLLCAVLQALCIYLDKLNIFSQLRRF